MKVRKVCLLGGLSILLVFLFVLLCIFPIDRAGQNPVEDFRRDTAGNEEGISGSKAGRFSVVGTTVQCDHWITYTLAKERKEMETAGFIWDGKVLRERGRAGFDKILFEIKKLQPGSRLVAFPGAKNPELANVGRYLPFSWNELEICARDGGIVLVAYQGFCKIVDSADVGSGPSKCVLKRGRGSDSEVSENGHP